MINEQFYWKLDRVVENLSWNKISPGLIDWIKNVLLFESKSKNETINKYYWLNNFKFNLSL